MELKDWKTGMEQHIPALEIFLKKVLLRKYEVQLSDTATGSNEDAVEKLQDSAMLIRAIEESFETEIIFGFSHAWIGLLSREILDVDEAQNNEITQDLFEELVTNLLRIIKGAFEELGIQLKIVEVEHIKSGKLNRSLNLQKYLTAAFSLDQKFTMDEDGEGPLNLTVAMARPNTDKVEMLQVAFSEENPFLNGGYEKISSRYAGQVDLERVGQGTPEKSPQPAGSNISMKGRNVEFEEFSKSSAVENNREIRNISILKNVEMDLSVELGRRNMPLGKILKLVKGSVIELEKLAGEPVEVLVNGHKIAQGDVVVIDEHFGVRITNMLATKESIRELN